MWRKPAEEGKIRMITCVRKGARDVALPLFSFPSVAAYEQYRQRFEVDPAVSAADCVRDESGCVLRHERPFLGADK
jgi:hypothetical protein